MKMLNINEDIKICADFCLNIEKELVEHSIKDKEVKEKYGKDDYDKYHTAALKRMFVHSVLLKEKEINHLVVQFLLRELNNSKSEGFYLSVSPEMPESAKEITERYISYELKIISVLKNFC